MSYREDRDSRKERDYDDRKSHGSNHRRRSPSASRSRSRSRSCSRSYSRSRSPSPQRRSDHKSKRREEDDYQRILKHIKQEKCDKEAKGDDKLFCSFLEWQNSKEHGSNRQGDQQESQKSLSSDRPNKGNKGGQHYNNNGKPQAKRDFKMVTKNEYYRYTADIMGLYKELPHFLKQQVVNYEEKYEVSPSADDLLYDALRKEGAEMKAKDEAATKSSKEKADANNDNSESEEKLDDSAKSTVKFAKKGGEQSKPSNA